MLFMYHIDRLPKKNTIHPLKECQNQLQNMFIKTKQYILWQTEKKNDERQQHDLLD